MPCGGASTKKKPNAKQVRTRPTTQQIKSRYRDTPFCNTFLVENIMATSSMEWGLEAEKEEKAMAMARKVKT